MRTYWIVKNDQVIAWASSWKGALNLTKTDAECKGGLIVYTRDGTPMYGCFRKRMTEYLKNKPKSASCG